jgi:diguanylate cyclase (GGDEF)-like protein/PAS domain S-box-containing protein
VQPSFEALVMQGATAIERITLTDEVNRRTSEDYFRTLIQSASDVILIVDDNDRIQYASPSADTVLGHRALIGTRLAGLIAEDNAPFLATLARTRSGRGRHEDVDLTAVRADGRVLQLECGMRDLRADPTVAGLVLTLRDVTERRRLETDLAHQAFHDGLTGLANRTLFQTRLEHAFLSAGRDHSTIGLLAVDLDDFKTVNDIHGQEIGDRLLAAVGGRIAQVAGPLCTVARMGGDEFAVLIQGAHSPQDADELAARIVAALAVPVEVGDGRGGSHVVSAAASVGVATSHEASSGIELQRQADLALYVAKGNGKNTWQRYRSDLHTAMVERLELGAALTDAVARDQLRLEFQPIVELCTEAVVGLEALVRWQHPIHGLIQPNDFIALAEENGAIVEIGAWVLGESLRAFVRWHDEVPTSALRYISVNVSARQFRTPGFVDLVFDALAASGANPEWLLLEITESLLLRDADQVWADLDALRAVGVRIAIDDFGTGYSSLSYLRQMPVDVLKIDKSFIDDILHSDQQRALVHAIVSLAKTLRLAVVAEGIEEEEHRQRLLEMGCPYGQGYLFSRPIGAVEVHTLISRRALVF